MPPKPADERVAAMVDFAALADSGDFDGKSPFASVEGGAEGIIARLVAREDVELAMVPVGKSGYAAMQLGQLVARAALGDEDRMALDAFVELGFGDAFAGKFDKALVKALGIMSGQKKSVGSKEGAKDSSKVLSEKEQKAIADQYGAPWEQLVACVYAIALGACPSLSAIHAMGWDSDPLDYSMFTSRRKSGQPMVHQLIKEKGAEALYEVHLSAAKELKSYGHYITSARMMSLILELHSLTIGVGYPEGYTAYWLDWLQVKRLTPIGDDLD